VYPTRLLGNYLLSDFIYRIWIFHVLLNATLLDKFQLVTAAVLVCIFAVVHATRSNTAYSKLEQYIREGAGILAILLGLCSY
jgi:hypothetical protein